MVPWKLILVLVLMTIFVVLAGFNIENVSDISVGFTVIKDVPVFLSIFIAFLAGAFFMLPFTFRKPKKGESQAVKSAMKRNSGRIKGDTKPGGQQPVETQTINPLVFENEISENEDSSDINTDEKG